MHKDFKAIALLCLITALCHGAYLLHPRSISRNPDWEFQATHHFFARKSLLEFHQFPLWCPYLGGGYPVLLNPEAPYLSPSLLVTLPFGEVVGLKLYAVLVSLAGVSGMYLLLRARGLSRVASVFGALCLVLSSWFAHRVRGGNINELHYMLFPSLALALHRRADRRCVLLGGALFAVIVIDGKLAAPSTGLVLIAYAALESVQVSGRGCRVDLTWVASAAAVTAIGLCLAAARLLLTAELFFGREATLFHRWDYYAADWVRALPPWGALWQLACAYWAGGRAVSAMFVGPVVLLCALCGLFRAWRRAWRMAAVGTLALVLVAAHHMPIDVFRILYAAPPFSSMQAPRKYFNFFIVFAVAAVAAEGLHVIQRSILGARRGLLISTILAGIVPLGAVSLWINETTYTAPPAQPLRRDEFKQVLGVGVGRAERRPLAANMYHNMRSETGTLDSYTAVVLNERAVPALFVREDGSTHWNPDYRSEAFLEDGAGTAKLKQLSANRIVIRTALERPAKLVVNQNFDPHWRCNVGTPTDTRGLLSVDVDRTGAVDVVFDYQPRLSRLALGLSGIAIVLWVFAFVWGVCPVWGRTHVWPRERCAIWVAWVAFVLGALCIASVRWRRQDETLYRIRVACGAMRFDQALRLFERSPESVRGHPAAVREAGLALLCLGQPAQAIDMFSRLGPAAERDANVANCTGIAHLLAEDLRAAERSFDHAIAIDPHGPDAYLLRAVTLAKQGKDGAASRELRRARLRGADDPATWRSIIFLPLLRDPDFRRFVHDANDPRGSG